MPKDLFTKRVDRCNDNLDRLGMAIRDGDNAAVHRIIPTILHDLHSSDFANSRLWTMRRADLADVLEVLYRLLPEDDLPKPRSYVT